MCDLGVEVCLSAGTSARVAGRHVSGIASALRERRVAVRAQPGPQPRGGLVHLDVGDALQHVALVEVGAAAAGPDVHVRMRDLVPLDQHADALGAELLALRAADVTGDREDVRGDLGIEVHPLVHLGTGHHHGVPELQRADREERDADLVGPDEAAGDLAVDDAREEGCHGLTVATGCDDVRMSRTVQVRVRPGSRRGASVTTDAEGVLVLTVRERAVDGKATEAAAALLAEHLGVRRRDVELVSGAASRIKIFRVAQ